MLAICAKMLNFSHIVRRLTYCLQDYMVTICSKDCNKNKVYTNEFASFSNNIKEHNYALYCMPYNIKVLAL